MELNNHQKELLKRLPLAFAIAFALAVILIVGGGCVTCNKCPPENAYIYVPPYGPVMIPEGFLDDRENWGSEEEFREMQKKMYENLMPPATEEEKNTI